jgi:hypothetical protein
MNSSEVLLNNAERYGLLVASSLNESADDDQSAVRQSRTNIGRVYLQFNIRRSDVHYLLP